MLKKREKLLNDKMYKALSKLKSKKESASKNEDEELYHRICQKEKSLRKKFRDQKEELSNLRYTLQVAERERQLLLGTVSHKMSIITIFGHKHLLNTKFDILHKKNFNNLQY